LAASLQIGALIAGADEKDSQFLYDYGKNLGIAFQLQDDILDVYGDKAKFGKQIGGDIISNKKTYLLLKAYQLAEGENLDALQNLINNNHFDPDEKVEAVTSIYNKLGIKEEATKEIGNFYQIALSKLDKINLDIDKESSLSAFADSLMIREI
jgi:geranylgeranyl diphosphate synthase type II